MFPAEFPRLRDYTNIPFEIFIAVFTILPFFVMAYFYPVLPNGVPWFMHLNGEVAEWAEKSVISVFRVPLLALSTQVICLLMKYGTLQSSSEVPAELATFHEQSLQFNARLWDWFRGAVAFKMSGESIDTIFLSLDLKSASRLTFVMTGVAALIGAAGALFYTYRILVVKRKMKEQFGDLRLEKSIDERHVYARLLYFNPSDPTLFSGKYIFNFGNKWAWVFIACLIAYPLLVFGPG
jgi:uncharacterized membrane protein